ncbi:MAG: hypothetical protein IT184_11850 [Acidobacteria bacterium]|nr:hypothetical protein [Acidobacteriota bacterium]
MTLHLTIEPPDTLVVHLSEGREETTVAVFPSQAGADSLLRALDDAVRDGYGECFWPGATGGQYWWIFKRDAESLQVIAMWTRGGASAWQHVFRATDAAGWIEQRLNDEVRRLGRRVS